MKNSVDQYKELKFLGTKQIKELSKGCNKYDWKS